MHPRLTVSMILLTALGTFTLPLVARANFNGNLNVEIDGLKNKEGQICASIFASSQGFPGDRDRVLERQCAKITDTSVKFTFANLKAGNYAVAVMHDENNDFKVNRTDLGFPLEGFGFSQNPVIRDRAPKFEETAVFVAGADTDIKIQLQYL